MSDWQQRIREDHERRTAEALERAVAGTHAFVVVDMDAPMRTMDLESHAPKVWMSPDVWRRIMATPSPLLGPMPLIPYVERAPAPLEGLDEIRPSIEPWPFAFLRGI